jgi:hypothetical protein
MSLEKQRYMHHLYEWDTKFATRSKNMVGFDHSKAIDLLLIRRNSTGLLLATDPAQGELVHDAFLSDYTAIIEAVSRVLGDSIQTALQTNQIPDQMGHVTFGLETGILEPLFWIGVRCREPNIRRQALHLLQRYPSREGICEGMLGARVVAKVINIEERGCSPAGTETCSTRSCIGGPWICEAHRVLTLEFILISERRIRVILRTVEDSALSRPGVEFVAWW